MIDWLIAVEYEAIPATPLTAARQCLLDGLACLLAGLHAQPIDGLRRVMELNSAGATGRVPIGQGRHAGLFDAANLYALAINILDFDDCYRPAPSHPAATIIGSALAVAHVLGSTGRELLTAIVKAYEASLRIGTALCPSDQAPSKDIGYATWQTFGAFVAAGALLKLDANQWLQGFGLTSQQAPVPMIVRANPEGSYTWLKNSYGPAAASGVMSAFLARQGFVGDQHFFSAEFGFWKTYGTDRFRPEYLASLPGDDWLIERVEFKPWACCRWSHPALEAVLKMKPAFDPDDVEVIDVYGFREFCATLDSPYPRTLVDAQFNIRFLIALALSHGDLNGALRDPDFGSPALRTLASKIHVHHDAQCDALRRVDLSIPTKVAVKLYDGRTFEQFVAEPSGSERRGIATIDETAGKLRETLAPLLPKVQIEALLTTLMSLESHTAGDLMAAAFPAA